MKNNILQKKMNADKVHKLNIYLRPLLKFILIMFSYFTMYFINPFPKDKFYTLLN